MKKIIILLIIISLFSNCLKQNKKEKTMLNERMEILKINNFKFPEDRLFRERIKTIFGLDVTAVSKDEFYLEIKPIVPDAPDFYPTVYIKEKYIDADNFKNNLSFVFFNKYIFYQDKSALDYLIKTDPYYLYMLVQDYGYYDEELLNYIFKEVDNDITSPFASAVFFGRKGINGKWKLKRDIFQKYLKYNPDINISAIGFIAPVLDKKNLYEGNREKDVAFILENVIERNEIKGIYPVGEADYIFEKYPLYLNNLKENNYYSFTKLKWYSQNKSDISGQTNYVEYYIQDPDGYTNLRKEPNSQSDILEKVKSGEEVEVLDHTEDWWQIKTKSGRKGYIHKSRIKKEEKTASNISKPLKEKEEESKKKYSFLADEQPLPKKKKGFWDGLFG